MQQLYNLLIPYLTALWHWRLPALMIAWLVSLLGWAVIAILPDRYTVTAQVVVDTETILAPLMVDLAVAPDFDRQVKMIRETLFAEPNIVELIERTGIDAYKKVVTPLDRSDLIEELIKEIDLEVDSKNLFTLSYTEKDPDVAFEVVSEMMDIFVQRNLGHSERDVRKASKFIDEQIAIYDQKLRDAELKVAEFQREHADELGGAEFSSRELERAEADLRSLRAEVESASWRRDQLKVKLDQTPRRIASSEAAGGGFSGRVSYLDELTQELARKRLVYTEEHPDILTLQQLIAQARRAAAEGEGGVINPLYQQLQNQLEVAEISVNDFSRRLKVAEGEVKSLTTRARQSPQAEADLKRLTRDYDVLLVHYEKLIKRREATQLATDLDSSRQRAEFRIVDPPVRPLEPSGPLHGLLLVAAMVVGVGAGGGYAVSRFMVSGVILTASQLQSSFVKVPVLGGVSIAEPPTPEVSRLAGHIGLAGGTVSLVLACAFLVYLYEFSDIAPGQTTPVTETIQSSDSTQARAGL